MRRNCIKVGMLTGEEVNIKIVPSGNKLSNGFINKKNHSMLEFYSCNSDNEGLGRLFHMTSVRAFIQCEPEEFGGLMVVKVTGHTGKWFLKSEIFYEVVAWLNK